MTSQELKRLKSLGVDGHTIASIARDRHSLIDTLDNIPIIKPEFAPEGTKLPYIKMHVQEQSLNRLLLNPIDGNPLIIIGSHITDERGKIAAAHIMNAALNMSRKVLWHPLYGSLGDPIRDKPQNKFDMLVLSNVALDSSTVKLEKLRDLLTMYSECARMVIVNGCNPIKFVADKLRMSPHHVLYFGNKVDVIDNLTDLM